MTEADPSQTPDAENKNLCMFDPAENVLPWTKQITLRAIVASLILSIVFNFIVMKLNLTTGVIPSLNVAAALIGFAMLKAYTALLRRFGWLDQPFTRQENTVIQTCVVASSGIAFSCGAGNYLLGMSATVAAQAVEGNDWLNVKNLKLGWITAYLLLVSFVGLFSIMPLRKRMILKYKLTYPSGTATAHLIKSFHTPKGTAKAKKQVSLLFKSFCGSFAFGFFKWFFAAGDNCGFGSFPTFGLQAYAQRFYFDFSTTYVGVGMICPYIVNVSMLLGAVLSWGIMWPLIAKKEGNWYLAGLASTSLHGLHGYKVFCAIAMILGDGLFQVVYMLVKTLPSLCKKDSDNNGPASNGLTVAVAPESQAAKLYEQRQVEYFLKDQIPDWLACLGYVLLAILSIICVPFIFPQLKWYHIIVVYVFAPILAFCNAYGCGLTDWSLASNYGKIAIICLSAWVGLGHGGIIAGLAGCGIMMNIVSTASDLMQDFKTGYLTLASPRSMFLSQVIGTAIGCISSPLVFWVFYKAYSIGDPTGSYPAPYGLLYRGIALLGAQGLSSLPKHCLEISTGLFAFAILLNLVREILKAKECEVYKFIPSAMSMAIPFYLGGYFVIDMCIGSVILYVWRKVDKRQADEFHAALASGLICGESLWSIPAAVLSMAGLNAPICMKFLSSAANKKVDAMLGA